MIADLAVIAATSASALAASKVVQSLANVGRQRVTKGAQDAAKRMQIEEIAENSRDPESTVTQVIDALRGTRNAIVIAGDLAVVKDSRRGEPHIIVKQLSPAQREKIDKHDAPVNDAVAFETWLADGS